MILIYFDNAATTSVDQDILNTYVEFVKTCFANAASNHLLGYKSYEYEKQARQIIANLFKKKEEEIIFTSGASEANNLAIKGTCFQYKNRGKHIITSTIEHASVLEAFKQLEKEFNFEVTYLKPNKNGIIEKDQIEKAIRNDTIFVSIMMVNNEIGSINDIDTIGEMLKKYPKIIFHSDITQAIGKIKVDLKNVDLASLSLHKIHGFKGSGILVKSEKINLMSQISGGGQEFNFRSGTNNVPYEVSAAKTLRIALKNQEENYQKCLKLKNYLVDELKNIQGVHINSPINGSPFIVNFSIDKKASVVTEALSKKEIYVSTKSACSSKKSSISYVLKEIGLDDKISSNAIRVSFSDNNTLDEVKIFLVELKKILESI